MSLYQTATLYTELGAKQMVFCAIHTIAKPYLEYEHLAKDQRGIDIPLVLMLMRWDGFIGFPGGAVDPGESLEQGLVRELKEEINYDLDVSRIEPLGSFSDSSTPARVNIHCWTLEVDPSEIKKIIADATQSKHFLSENQGCFAVQVAEFVGGNGFRQFRKNNFKATAGYEIDLLIKKLGNKFVIL